MTLAAEEGPSIVSDKDTSLLMTKSDEVKRIPLFGGSRRRAYFSERFPLFTGAWRMSRDGGVLTPSRQKMGWISSLVKRERIS